MSLFQQLWLLLSVSYTHLRAHETPEHLVCRLLLEKKKDDFIIPATHFKSLDYTKAPSYSISEEVTVQPTITKEQDKAQKEIEEVQKPSATIEEATIAEEETKEPVKVEVAPPKIQLKNLPNRVSGLSLSSLKAVSYTHLTLPTNREV